MLPSQDEFSARPPAQGLYTGHHEHDACGVGFVATMRGTPGHDIVAMGLAVLRNLDHRGAVGAETNTGDGAGILLQVPDRFLRAVVDFDLPAPGHYAAGMVFLPDDDDRDAAATARIEQICVEEGLTVLGWRDVPVTADLVGTMARDCMPRFRQLFLAHAAGTRAGLELDRLVYCARKRFEHATGAYAVTLSSRTLGYKGMLTTGQLEPFFPDLSDQRMASALAIVHSRFSTNTFPSWPLAHPFRFLAHNGEINTVQGNRNWMNTRESDLQTDVLPGELSRILPICTPGASDSATFDEVLELLHLAGRSLPHSVLMMIPEAWENHETMDPRLRAFYEFHSILMEPWDGPADLVFTDGDLIGAVLDRNGLRPSRYWVTADGLVVLASETGVLDGIDPATVVKKGRLTPGRMFLVDTAAGRLVDDEEIKTGLATEHPYEEWLGTGLIRLADLPEREHVQHTAPSVVRRQQTFGYTDEELTLLLAPMAEKGVEPIGSMGTDTPIAVLSSRPRLLFDYFTQLFAQVTNPPLDAIREELVTSMSFTIGPEGNLLGRSPTQAHNISVTFPVIDNDELAKLVRINQDGDLPGFASHQISCLYPVRRGGEGLRERLDEICAEASEAIAAGARFLILSDRDSDGEQAPIPSLLATSAVHHHLIREKSRTRAGLVVEAGDVREVHHVALLIGYGASAINPYLAMESAEQLSRSGRIPVDPQTAVRRLIHALGKGVLKVMSKMGISTVASYQGAQVFEAIGLSQELVDRYFTGTVSQLDGVGLDVLAAEVAERHAFAYPVTGQRPAHRTLTVGGEYQWRRDGEAHLFNPDTVFRLQHATRAGRYDIFKEYTRLVDDQSRKLMTLRGLFRLRTGQRPPVPLEEVEPVSEIVRRFSTGAMSYGSISMESHETLAIAMNRLGGRSNTGEGGEDVERLLDPQRRSSVKQVASGRFGVTSMYLTHADDIQIKMAQGAKPGEGGQLPGAKVYPWVARTRHSTPGVGLISPPPHHDIYSIEDLAQLIHDLKNANPQARIHVKLVAEIGVGTVAAGVCKAHADVVLISGHDGGTGASPLTSLKHAGAPWEIGLAETQQTLLLNGLRDRIVVQADGQLKTGRDVIIAALLGAEEYGFATAPLVVSGCILMRVCHLDTCPVGIATQNPELRARYSGRPEFVVNFFEYIAEEVREYLAALGFRSLDELVGRSEYLDTDDAHRHWKTQGLDLSRVLHQVDLPEGTPRTRQISQDHGIAKALDNDLITMAADALQNAVPVSACVAVRNVNRTVGTMLGHEVTRRYGEHGLPAGTIDFTMTGSGGQSFGAFVPRGITLRLLGDANDYLGKGLCGGIIAVRPDPRAGLVAEDNVIAGNTIGYGATAGEIYLRGLVGERFCVRNSGATAVVEGVGDHGCEYMTGGTVLVLGGTGRNFGAGMSGGTAYVLDLDPGLLNPQAARTGELTPEVLTDADWLLVQDLLGRHLGFTGSAVAEAVLADPAGRGRFSKLMPREYATVLAVRAQARDEGLDPDGDVAWGRIMEGISG